LKVHLVFAPHTFPLNHGDLGKGIDPPLGILYLASYLKKYGPSDIEIKATDGALIGYEKTLEAVTREKADVIGISAVTTNALGAYRLAKDIKKTLPRTKIVFGGPHPTAMPEEVFKYDCGDAVVVGEGEATFLELMEHYYTGHDGTSQIEQIAGLCIERDGRPVMTPSRGFIKDLDTIPFPRRDLLDMEQYSGYPITQRRPTTTIFMTRGCPFNCTYCSNNIWRCGAPAYRSRSPQNIIAELRELKAAGYKEFFDNSDEFNTGLKRTKNLLREIIESGLSVKLKCQLRATPMDDELAMLMKEAGVWYVHLGIESGNPATLNGIKKKITLAEVEACCRTLKKYDIKIWGLFMYFNVWEENGRVLSEDYRMSMNTFNYAKKLFHDGLIDFFGGTITTPIPGSELWDIAVRHNLIKEDFSGDWDRWFYKKNLKLVSRYPGVPESDIFKLHQKTVKYTILSLLKSKVVDLKNLRFNLTRAFYYFRREVLRWMKKTG